MKFATLSQKFRLERDLSMGFAAKDLARTLAGSRLKRKSAMAGSADVLVRITGGILHIRLTSGSRFALIADGDVRAPSKTAPLHAPVFELIIP